MSRPNRTSESVKPDILSEDVQRLQQMLDSLHGYCNKWICNMYDWLVDGLTEVKDLALNMC